MTIEATHPQYNANEETWKEIGDIIDQKNLSNYLIKLNPKDTSEANKARNEAYIERAVFYALTAQTVTGFIGIIFDKLPELDVPTALDYLKKNVDGRGNSIYQQSQKLTKGVASKSRAGLFVSFPKFDGPISRADVTSGRAIATIQRIEPKKIRNWRESSVGSITKLTLLVLDDVRTTDDGYELKEEQILRELYLDGNVYKERKWEKLEGSDKWTVIVDSEITPVDHAGQPLSEIPFTFCGSENNDSDVDVPAMQGMVKLNIAHYRNSADFEDSVWFAGQTQPWMSNVDQEHVDLMKDNNMYVGSREVLAVPENGQFGFASAPPNPAVRQAMIDKVDMMIGIGARMITPGGVAKTAEQSSNEREVQHSPLSLVAENVSDAYNRCLKWIGIYNGVEIGESKYEVNQDFVKVGATPADLKEVIAGFVAGTIPMGDYVTFMKKYGLFDEEKTAEDYSEELDQGFSSAEKE